VSSTAGKDIEYQPLNKSFSPVNFLAHLFLSYPDPELQTGNFLADLIRNKEFDDFPSGIQKGVRLHRFIDSFTDQHPAVSKSVHRLMPIARKYAPVVIDIFYDYLLAQNWERYAGELTFEAFSHETYQHLMDQRPLLPKRLQKRLQRMIEDQWLDIYRTRKGIKTVMRRMDMRTKFPSAFEMATEELLDQEAIYNEDFNTFFPVLIEEIKQFT